jgi:hypothetical protein
MTISTRFMNNSWGRILIFLPVPSDYFQGGRYEQQEVPASY